MPNRSETPLRRAAKPLLAIVLATLVMGSAFHLTQMSGLPKRIVGTVEEPPTGPCLQSRSSVLATKYLENLHGIEIGASTQNSFRLKRAINVDFSDEQGGLWQSSACAPAVVNIVALGDDLPFKDNTLDYVLSSHVIEHFSIR
jgi:Methyltransferase domain